MGTAPGGTPIVITGVGVLSAAGAGREAFHDALHSGRSGISAHPTPAPGADDTGVALTARIDDLGARRHFDPRALRRMARLSQMALVATREALQQASGSSEKLALPWPGERVGVVLGTGLGTLRETIEFMRGYLAGGPEQASPLLFPSSVVNAAAGQVAIELGLRGPNSTVNHRETSPLDALQMACDLLRLGRVDAVCVGGVDELSGPLLHGAGRLGRLSSSGMRPYADDRDGTVMGEGAAILVLERAETAAARGAVALARVGGQAARGEARARVGWHGAPGSGEVIAAALAASGLGAAAVSWVAGGGNGGDLDAVEADAVRAAMGEGATLSSILGQTGEFFGSAALRLAAAVWSLGAQRIPGTRWEGEGAGATAILTGVLRGGATRTVDSVLVPAFAQGGAEAAAVILRA